jgi:methyltransferase (TIGR00027 family)
VGLGNRDAGRLAASTAEAMAALRAAGSAAPDAGLRNPDHLAWAFVSLQLRPTAFARVRGLRRIVPGIAERLVPGGYFFECARVKHMDAILDGELALGIRQLAILGAGYDTRAYRFAHRLGGVRVYEVDHPLTAALKRQKVTRLLGALPKHVSYVDADFRRDDLSARLTAHGYDLAQSTLLILCGVSQYLPESAMTALLGFTAAHASPLTSIVFDYAFREMVDGGNHYRGAAQARRRVKQLGEPFVFGIPAGQAGPYLAAHGLRLLSDLGPDDLADRYLRRGDGTTARPYGFVAIAHARVTAD